MCLPTRWTQSIRDPSRVRAISSAGDFSRLVLSPIHTDSMTSPATCRCRLRAVVSTSGSSGTSSVYGRPRSGQSAHRAARGSPAPGQLVSARTLMPLPAVPGIEAQILSRRNLRTRLAWCCARSAVPAPACDPSSVRHTFQAANPPCWATFPSAVKLCLNWSSGMRRYSRSGLPMARPMISGHLAIVQVALAQQFTRLLAREFQLEQSLGGDHTDVAGGNHGDFQIRVERSGGECRASESARLEPECSP